MIVKILGNKGGGSAGAAIDYMLGKKRDRDGAILLSGDPDLTAVPEILKKVLLQSFKSTIK